MVETRLARATILSKKNCFSSPRMASPNACSWPLPMKLQWVWDTILEAIFKLLFSLGWLEASVGTSRPGLRFARCPPGFGIPKSPQSRDRGTGLRRGERGESVDLGGRRI